MNLKRLISELKRRNVFKVAAVYAVTGWLLIQVATSVFPAFKFPGWTTQFVIILVLIGLPIALIIAWAFELTPEGVKRTEETPHKQPAAQPTGRKLNYTLIIVLVLAVIILSYKLFAGQPAAATTPGKSIAVLPFENLSTDSSNAYFADGMQDMILTKLDQVGGLKVISRTSTEKYKSHPDNLTKIASELHVATVLEGSVQKAGNQVLINVQLIDAHTDHHLWANDYTRTLNNIFGVEGDVAGRIANTLKIKLAPNERKTISKNPTDNGEAFDLFLKANFQVDQYFEVLAWPDSALTMYHRVIRLDTSFAQAYARLAFAELTLSRIKERDSLLSQAQRHAREAIRINPNLALAHLYLGEVYDALNPGDDRVETEWEMARKLSPNDPEVLGQLARFVDWNKGRFDSALAKQRLAVELDPKNSKRYLYLGATELYLRHYNKALKLIDQAGRINPEDDQVFDNKVVFYILLGNPLRARKEEQKFEKLSSSKLIQFGADAHKYWIDRLSRHFRHSILDLQMMDSLAHELRKKGQSGFGVWQPGLFKSIPVRIAETYYFMGNKNQVRRLSEQAIKQYDTAPANETVTEQSDRLGALAYCLAYLGQSKKAIATIKKAIQLTPVSGHFYDHYRNIEALSEIYAQFGDAAHAVPILQQLFKERGTGYIITAHLLKNDPVWDHIRMDHAFQALIHKYIAEEVIS